MRCLLFFLFLPTILSFNQTEFFCRHRDEIIPEKIWSVKVGGECYYYALDHWLGENTLLTNICPIKLNNVTYRIYCNVKENGTIMLFNHTDVNATNAIRNSFREEKYYEKWMSCVMNAEDCCKNDMTSENIYPTEDYPCPAMWDAWSCIPPTKNDTKTPVVCPEYSTSSTFPCNIYGFKECFANGTWDPQTNYSNCVSAPIYKSRYNFNVITGYVSVALSTPAVLIFVCFKKLHKLRFDLHRNLIAVCIIRNVFNIMSKEIVLLDALKNSTETKYVMLNNSVACRSLAFFSNVSINAMYACMLIDGYYVHKLIVRVFAKNTNELMLYISTVVLSVVPSIVWASVVATQANENCWLVDNSWYQWISDGCRIGMLSVNMLLMLDIFRVLIKNLSKRMNSNQTKYTYVLINGLTYVQIIKRAFTSTAKAMLFLMPLFGVPFILTANRNIVDQSSCLAGDIYNGASSVIQALQGVMVAVLFCYCNREVRAQIKETYRKTANEVGRRITLENSRRTTNRTETTTAAPKEDNL